MSEFISRTLALILNLYYARDNAYQIQPIK